MKLLAVTAAPARGTPLSDLVPAIVVAVIAQAVVLLVVWAHRRGSTSLLARLSGAVETRMGVPGWAAVPSGLALGSLTCAVFGYYWDVAWHIDRGRDQGAFANPAHWFIFLGLAGIALAGVLSLALADHRISRASVQLTPGWRAPVGGVMLTLCGVVALAGFPLDDVWHRIFGQDVTAWGPTHIQMIGGASLATLAVWMLAIEGRRFATGSAATSRRYVWFQDVLFGAAFLVGLSTLQVEFDFGVPQFRLLEHPVLLMLAAGIGLVAVRIRAGRGAALATTIGFLVIRGGLTLVVAGALGRSTPHFPLYLVEAAIVELVALRVPVSRQLTFGAWAGLGIGTVGLAAEWAWSQIWMPLPWHASMLPEGIALGLVAAVSGGIIGGFIGRALAPEGLGREPTPRLAAVGAWAGALLCIGLALPMSAPAGWRAQLTLDDVVNTRERRAFVTARLDPPAIAQDAHWFQILSWQGRKSGDNGLESTSLRRVAPGVYRSTRAVPVSGTWKTILRLHTGRDLVAVPVYLPADPAIPAEEVAARPVMTRAFVRDKAILQREAIGGTVLEQRGAYAVLAAIGVAWIASLGWGLRRLEDVEKPEPGAQRPPRVRVSRGARTRPASGSTG